MKIKLYSIIAAAAFTVSVMSGCKKDFLDKTPFNQATGDVAFVDLAGAEKLLAGAYGSMYKNVHIEDLMVHGDVTSDNAYAGGDNPNNIAMDLFTVNATNSNIDRDWAQLYTNIKDANEVLENVPNIQDPALDANGRREQILGEASALRAYFYFYLTRVFGAVPLVLKSPTTLEEMKPAKASVEEVYTQIIKDLEYALANVGNTAADKGIITKGIVNALLAKAHATKPNPDYAKVIQYSDAVINGGYRLMDNYDQLFDGAHENNTEAVWEMQFDGWGGPRGRGNWVPGQITGSGWKRFNTPSNDLAEAFDTEGDAIRGNTSIKFLNSSSENWSDIYWPKNNYPYINKYRIDDKSNIYIIRLADIILLKAEALNEAGAGGYAQAKLLVDQIRDRVDLLPTTANDQASMRLAIEKERRLELAFEGQRWFDLTRTNRAIAVMNAQKNGQGASLNYNITSSKLISPIPQTEIDRNPNVR